MFSYYAKIWIFPISKFQNQSKSQTKREREREVDIYRKMRRRRSSRQSSNTSSPRSFPRLTMMSVTRQGGDFEKTFSTSIDSKKARSMQEKAALRVAIYQSKQEEEQVKSVSTEKVLCERSENNETMDTDESRKDRDEKDVVPPWLSSLPRFPNFESNEEKAPSFRLFSNVPGEHDNLNWKKNRRLVKIVNEARVNERRFDHPKASTENTDGNSFDWFDDENGRILLYQQSYSDS